MLSIHPLWLLKPPSSEAWLRHNGFKRSDRRPQFETQSYGKPSAGMLGSGQITSILPNPTQRGCYPLHGLPINARTTEVSPNSAPCADASLQRGGTGETGSQTSGRMTQRSKQQGTADATTVPQLNPCAARSDF